MKEMVLCVLSCTALIAGLLIVQTIYGCYLGYKFVTLQWLGEAA